MEKISTFFRTVLGPELQRRWLLANTRGTLREYYRVKYPDPRSDWRDLEYVALDFETTGLNPGKSDIASMGWVVIREGRVDLSRSEHHLVKPRRGLNNETTVIHGITHDDLEGALRIDHAMEILLPVLAGRVLVAHHAKIERGFLHAACVAVYGMAFEMHTVDTLMLERRSYRRQNKVECQGEFRLDEVRQRYNLPRYRAHNAQIDAIATAELFLAQMQHICSGKGYALRDIML